MLSINTILASCWVATLSVLPTNEAKPSLYHHSSRRITHLPNPRKHTHLIRPGEVDVARHHAVIDAICLQPVQVSASPSGYAAEVRVVALVRGCGGGIGSCDPRLLALIYGHGFALRLRQARVLAVDFAVASPVEIPGSYTVVLIQRVACGAC